MKRKIIFLIAATCLASTITVGSTLAWLSDKDSAKNTFSIGNVDVTLVEENWNPEEGKDIYPGKTVTKDPIVKNVGNNPCYVRAKIIFSNESLKNYIQFNDLDTTNWVYNESDGYYYFQTPVSKNSQTTELFKSVTLKDNYKETDIISFDIDVYTEAVQSEGFNNAQAAFSEITK